ncbi:MAG: polysaccharide biosynthesis/export family protein [Pedobacter sp.]|uniref:polysaccharide biosynthesis/export family protein n=1 Tax=Pedobacter sp. TaxID=1411316 RepID=UPI00339082D2
MKTILPLLLTIIIAISACSGRRNLVYFSDLDLKSDKWKNITDNGEPVILKNDVLSISVNTSSSESNMIFASAQSAEMVNGVYEKQGYRVNGEGNIKFPFLGEVTLEGLTLSQAQDQLERQLINYAKHPIVNMKFMNFRVTVIGEVNHPSTFLVPNEKINLLEALGLAGDMTAYGKRENVLLIREVNNVRTMTRINLNSQDVLNSPYFYLKQNDVIYVEPDKAKSYEVSKSTKMMPFVIAGLSAIAIFGATLISR